MSVIKVPNLGDGITSAIVLSILVKPGDTISKDQIVLELETDKATAPIPATEAGVVETLLIKEGDTVSSGTPIITLSGSGTSAPASATPAAPATPPQTPIQAPISPNNSPITAPTGAEPPASPSVRKIANDIGLDLRYVTSTEKNGRITMSDIRQFIQTLLANSLNAPSSTHTISAEDTTQKPIKSPLPDFGRWGEVEIKTLTSLRKKIGQKMTESWTTIPHVTQFEDVNITHIMDLRKKYNPRYKEKGTNLTLTTFAIKALVNSLKAFPNFNASFNDEKGELILKNYYNFGVAVDTENGLIVPVIKHVDQKNGLELSQDIQSLAEKARTRQIAIEDLQGGTFTLTNLGGLGVGAFTPIINAPEVAILALSAGKMQPVVVDGSIQIQLRMPISLSYDHRVIDGADAARFIRHYINELENFVEDAVKI